MKTEIYIWSRIGHTPVTKRGGLFCDVLIHADVDCESPEAARKFVRALIAAHPHGNYGHFNMPEYWNHNTRSGFTH